MKSCGPINDPDDANRYPFLVNSIYKSSFFERETTGTVGTTVLVVINVGLKLIEGEGVIVDVLTINVGELIDVVIREGGKVETWEIVVLCVEIIWLLHPANANDDRTT